MSDEWVETTLGDIADIVGGGTPSTKEPTYWNGDVVWLTPTEVVKADGGSIGKSERCITQSGMDRSSAKLLPAKTVLLTSRASVGFAALASVPLTTNQGFQSLIAKPSVLPEFLLLWIQGNREEFRSRASGSTFPEISKGKVASIPIILPPLAIQRRIVDLMTHLDTHLANLRAERAAITNVAAAQQTAILVPDEEWDSGPLGDCAEVRLGRMLSKERSLSGSLAPYIRNANVQWKGLDLSDLKWMDFPVEDRAKYALRAGDILVCEGGDPGRAVFLDEDIEGVYYQKAIHRLRSSASIDAQFLYFWLAEAYVDGRIDDLCTNTTIKHLTAEKFKTLNVRFPSIDVQKAIAAQLRKLRDFVSSIDAEISAMTAMRTVLLGGLLMQEVVINPDFDGLLSEVV